MKLQGKKCLFFVQGDGRGHMTQSLSMKQILEDAGIQVCEVIVGKSKYRQVPGFYYQKIGVPVTRMESPNMARDSKAKGVNPFFTLIYNVLLLPRFIKSLKIIDRKIKEHKPDIVINFYEPLCGLYYLMFRPKVPMVSIGHHYMFLHTDFSMPGKNKLAELSLKIYTRLTTAGATKKLALSFYPFSNDVKHSIYVVPPLLRKEVAQHPTGNDNYLLVYLLNSGYMEDIIRWHKKNPKTVLHCFTDNKETGEEDKYDDTLYFHRLNDIRFLDMMANAKGVVTTAGFESVCEAMYMGKPVFMVPVEGHYEQFCNSRDAAKAGAGLYDKAFNISSFLTYISNYAAQGNGFKSWAAQSGQTIIKHIHSVLFKGNNVRHIYPYGKLYKRTAH